MEIIERVRGIAAPFAEQQGVEIVEIIYRTEGGGLVLRFLVDRPGGITLGECERLNTQLGDLLDKADIITAAYTLEVSSPGVDRPLTTDSDFKRVMGRQIEISAYEPIDGKRDVTGSLIGMNADEIVVESAGVSTVIPRTKIARARQRSNVNKAS